MEADCKSLVFKVILALLVIFLHQTPTYSANASDVSNEQLSDLQELLKTKVTTASRNEEKLDDAPATLRVITKEQIEDRGYKDLKDIFSDLPGFDVSKNLEGEVRTLAMSRGVLGANKLLVLKNGRRLNSPGGERFVLGNNHPLHNIKRIEIMYGPAATIYGADAYSGVVNMISKGPSEIGGNNHNMEVDYAYGSNNRNDFALAAGQSINDDVSYKLSARIFQSNGEDVLNQFNVDEITFENTPEEFRRRNPQGWEQPINNYNLSGQLNVNNLTVGFRRESAEEPNGPSTEYINPGDTGTFVYDDQYIWHQIMNKIYVDHEYESSDFSLKTSLEYNDYEIDPQTNFHYSDLPGNPDSIGFQYKFAKNKSTELETVLKTDLGDNTEFTGGFSIESVSLFPKTSNLKQPFNRDQLIDQISYPDTSSIDEPYRGDTTTFGVFDERNIGLFAELSHDLTDNLMIQGGLRFDYNTNYKETYNPRLNVVWNPSDKTNVKVLYGEAYIQPSKYIAYEHFNAGGAFGAFPNPDLQPEELKSYQMNFSHYLTDDFKTGLNTFIYKIQNLHRTKGGPFFKNVASGKPQSQGFELTFDYSLSNAKTYLYYSYLDSERNNGEPQAKVADHKINAGITYDWSGISLSPRVRWSDEIPRLEGGSTTNQSPIDSHTVVDFDVRTQDFWNQTDLYLSLRNLFDEKYYTASPFGEDGDGFLMEKAPQPGINGEVGVTYRF